ncbi:hypothetical protein K440DRAFT_560881 [Wilcoxina mikolae CBS 423.85]|nr:hypothetical protein K440DRAFT_560881 [Wilcoxina mikolae CBS 423.85]
MPTPIDDRTIASRFDGLAQEIKDWSLSHLRRNPGPHEFSPDLRGLLRTRVPDYERLLTIPKTRGLVVRAAVSAILADAFEDGYLFPGGTGVRAVEKGMRKNMSDSDFNSWRCSTYASIAASFGSERDFLPALEPLAQRIDALVAPFADAQESSGRLKYLHRILYTFVTLSLTLLSQPARFHILDPKPPPTFDCRTMDDVLQENETKYSNTGRPENPLQGRQCSAVVFPGVEKWGNGQLGPEAEWESLIVVVKARVLV